MAVNIETDLPLKWRTPLEWADAVLQHPLALLNDHAHLERKAALNALELLGRWPDPHPPQNWIEVNTAVARDEVDHLATVTRIIIARGGRLEKHHRNPYATSLRSLVRIGQGPVEVIDRLLVSALIEARSCERFYLLSERSDDTVLRALYKDLYASEAGHFHVFLQLAFHLDAESIIQARWEHMLDAEAGMIECQEPGPRMHSGL